MRPSSSRYQRSDVSTTQVNIGRVSKRPQQIDSKNKKQLTNEVVVTVSINKENCDDYNIT